jgi:hypothetical protein
MLFDKVQEEKLGVLLLLVNQEEKVLRACRVDEIGSEFIQPEFVFMAIKSVFITAGMFVNSRAPADCSGKFLFKFVNGSISRLLSDLFSHNTKQDFCTKKRSDMLTVVVYELMFLSYGLGYQDIINEYNLFIIIYISQF